MLTDLWLVDGKGNEARFVGAELARMEEAGVQSGAKQHHQRIGDAATAMHLNCQVEPSCLRLEEKSRDACDVGLLLGQARVARKLEEVIEIVVEAVDE